jgi:hypothetical protein
MKYVKILLITAVHIFHFLIPKSLKWWQGKIGFYCQWHWWKRKKTGTIAPRINIELVKLNVLDRDRGQGLI